MSSTRKRGALLSAFGAAAALTAGGLVVAPAAAEEGAPTASIDDKAFVKEAFAAEGVTAVVTDGQNVIIKRAAGDSGEGGISALSAEATGAEKLQAQYSNVVIQDEAEPLVPKEANELVGGAGYVGELAGSIYTCSTGFTAWSPEGEPAVVTAGHCTSDGAITDVSRAVPSQEEAVGGPGFVPWDALGTFGFSQFGGPGNSTSQDTENDRLTDVAIIDGINPELVPRPEVTDWTTASNDDLAASTTKVSSVGTAQIGDTIERSGRTTGRQAGQVIETGYYMVEDRVVYGHAAEQIGDEPLVLSGDSGGSVVVGETAVGVVSGGTQAGDILVFTDLEYALDTITEQTGAPYQIALDIAEPSVTEASSEIGGTFQGEAPANAEVTITGDIEATVTADDNGVFSFEAPGEVGSFDIALQAKQGFNVSEKVNATVETTAVQLDAPGITSPENESSTTEAVTQITGTGRPGATVTLQGDAEGTATVGEDGTWSVATELGFGAYTVGVTQSLSGTESDARWVSFQVVPGAPTIVTPTDGGQFVEGELPGVVGESPINGATVSVDIEGPEAASAQLQALRDAGDATVADGTWRVDFPEQLVPGAYTVTATQSIDGVSSAPVSVSFEVVGATAPPEEEPGDEGNGGGENPGDQPGDEQPGDGNDDGLAPTGADNATLVLPLAGGAAVLLLAGATLLVVRRVTRA